MISPKKEPDEVEAFLKRGHHWIAFAALVVRRGPLWLLASTPMACVIVGAPLSPNFLHTIVAAFAK